MSVRCRRVCGGERVCRRLARANAGATRRVARRRDGAGLRARSAPHDEGVRRQGGLDDAGNRLRGDGTGRGLGRDDGGSHESGLPCRNAERDDSGLHAAPPRGGAECLRRLQYDAVGAVPRAEGQRLCRPARPVRGGGRDGLARGRPSRVRCPNGRHGGNCRGRAGVRPCRCRLRRQRL